MEDFIKPHLMREIAPVARMNLVHIFLPDPFFKKLHTGMSIPTPSRK